MLHTAFISHVVQTFSCLRYCSRHRISAVKRETRLSEQGALCLVERSVPQNWMACSNDQRSSGTGPNSVQWNPIPISHILSYQNPIILILFKTHIRSHVRWTNGTFEILKIDGFRFPEDGDRRKHMESIRIPSPALFWERYFIII